MQQSLLNRMLEDHGRIRQATAAVRDHLIAERMPMGVDFATTRWTLSRELLCHLALDAKAFATVPERQLETEAMQQRYRRHLADWPVLRMDEEWHAYRSEALAILSLVEEQMNAEEQSKYAQ